MANRFFRYPWSPWTLKFDDPQTEQLFISRTWPPRRIQMRLATVGAGFLYCIYALVDILVLADNLQFALSIHLLVNLPILLGACTLSFFNRFDHVLPLIVALPPIVCNLTNLFIVARQGATALYLPEPYLIILWVYTTSGLRLTHANITALIMLATITAAMILMFQLSPQKLLPHTYWLMVAMFLGFLGCYLLERSSRINFLMTEKLKKEALERKKAKDNIARRARWAEGLQKASQDLSLCRHIEEIARVTSRSVVEYLGLTNAWVGVPSQDGSIKPLSVYGDSGDTIQKEGENCQIKVVQSGQSFVVPDVEASPPFEDCPAYAEKCHFGSCATFPISAGGECVGTLTIRSPDKGDQAGVTQIAPMIETLVQQVGHVWQRCLAEEDLKKLSRAIESSPASVVITDTYGTIEYVNPRFSKITGYSAKRGYWAESKNIEVKRQTRIIL